MSCPEPYPHHKQSWDLKSVGNLTPTTSNFRACLIKHGSWHGHLHPNDIEDWFAEWMIEMYDQPQPL